LNFWPLANVLRKLTRDNKKQKSSAPTDNQIYAVPANQFSPSTGTTLSLVNLKQPENQILIPDWSYFHCPDKVVWVKSPK